MKKLWDFRRVRRNRKFCQDSNVVKIYRSNAESLERAIRKLSKSTAWDKGVIKNRAKLVTKSDRKKYKIQMANKRRLKIKKGKKK